MANKIDHKTRKTEIIAASIKLFAVHGYSGVNYAMIAKSCKISRTLLYTYFKDKRAIFNAAIRGVTRRVEAKYYDVIHSRHSADAKLRQICITAFAMLFDNRDFVCVISDYLAELRRKGTPVPQNYILRHTLGLRRIIHSLIIEAKHNGEYRADVDADRLTTILYSQFEAVALRIVITGNAELSESIDQVDGIIFSLRA